MSIAQSTPIEQVDCAIDRMSFVEQATKTARGSPGSPGANWIL